jgi:hypothetical protein
LRQIVEEDLIILCPTDCGLPSRGIPEGAAYACLICLANHCSTPGLPGFPSRSTLMRVAKHTGECWWAGVNFAREKKKIEARKMIEKKRTYPSRPVHYLGDSRDALLGGWF